MSNKVIYIFLIAFSILAFSNTVKAEELRNGYKYPGYIIQNNYDTIYGYIKYSDVVRSQNKCEFYKNENDKKPFKKYKPKELKGYLISDVLYKTINYSGGLMSKPLRFLKVNTEGELTIFTFWEEGSIPYNREREQTAVYFKWHDKKNVKPITNSKFAFSFAKKMSAYVADNKELSKKVRNKEKGYNLLHLYDIINEYNEWYAAKNN